MYSFTRSVYPASFVTITGIFFLVTLYTDTNGQTIGYSDLSDHIHTTVIPDTLHLDEILIRSTRIAEPLRYQPVDVQRIDSLQLNMYRSMPVSTVLSRYSSLFIRDNGPGGMAVVSQRGLSASQSQVLWEGFPVNSLSLGLADLSVIPAGLFHSVEVSPGTPSSSFGGGSLGGSVYLSSSRPADKSRLEFIQSAGAFNTWNSQFRTLYAGDQLSVSLQGVYHTAENDFSYVNRASGQVERRLNNSGRSGHLMSSVRYQLSRTELHTSFWYFDSSDKIPGSILSGSSSADQTNRGLRWTGGLETRAGSWNLKLNSFLENTRFGYDEPPVVTESRFTLGRWLTDIEFRRPSAGIFIWQGGLSGGLETVNTNNYAERRQRTQLGLRLNPDIRLADGRLRLTPAARIEYFSDFGAVLSPALGVNREILEDQLYLRGMVSRDFNSPSFNDLYWVPGGNPDLEPERSYKVESGITYHPTLPFFESLHLTGYRIWMENGIYWLPNQENIWAPSNIEEVDAYGFEASLKMRRQFHLAELFWSLGADWRRSEIASQRFTGDQAVGQQMRYVPEWTLRSEFHIRVTPVSLHLNYQWTDRRYITEDHTSRLDAFRTLDLSASTEHSFLGADWHFRFSVNNLLDEHYEIIQWYPMPGRHLTFTLGMGLPM